MTLPRTICLGFLAVITVGTLLLLLPFATSDGSWNDPLVALFTATSAVCVTGLIIVDTGTYFSTWGQFIILLLIQAGGLGYMTLTTFLMLLLGRRLGFQEKIAIEESFDRPFLMGSKNLITSILATTLLFELSGIIILLGLFSQEYGLSRGLWLAIFHSISAWNNAGFSLFPDSLVRYQNSLIINFTIPALIIFGGIGYQVIIEMYYWFVVKVLRRKKVRFIFSLNFKVVTSTTFFLLVFGTISFFFTELANPAIFGELSFREKVLSAWFQSVTTRTAGFNTIDLSVMTTAGLFLTTALMFFGASPSGTGGGAKTTTLRILANSTRSVLQGKEEVHLYEREVPYTLIIKAIGIVFGSGMIIVIGVTLISAVDSQFDFIAIFFEVVSAFATVGLSTGITASISAFSKFVLICLMYIGRVSVLLFMTAILGETPPSSIKYPEENLLVG